MIRFLAAILASLLIPSAAPASPTIEAALARHIAVLASDAYEGRQPGTAGETPTLGYIAAAFAKAGLKPGAADGGWYQRVLLAERKPIATHLTLHPERGAARPFAGELVFTGREAAVRLDGARVIYAGYATAGQLKGADLTGALVIYRTELPAGLLRPTAGERREAMHALGAAAVVAVTDRTTWPQVLGFVSLGTTSLLDPAGPADLPLRGAASPVTARALLRAAGADAALYTDAARPGFRATLLPATVDLDVTSEVRTYPSYNVIGQVAGRDAHGEAVAFTAHWDHLGLCRPAGTPDRICNGAIDNASGVAALIEIAHALARHPPERDMLFVATTAEETGLLGAEAFATAPPRPLARIVAGLNLDTLAVGHGGQPVAILGRGATPALDAVVDETAARLGRPVNRAVWANALIDRQDGWALARRGLPSVMIGGGLANQAALEGFLAGIYHTPQDDVEHLPPLDGAAEDVALHVAVGEALGDRARFPGGR